MAASVPRRRYGILARDPTQEDDMADWGLFIGFGYPVRGREQKATQVFGEAVEFFGQRQQEGGIESFEGVFLEPHGGDLGGFFIVRGEKDALARLRASEEFLRLNTRAQLVVESFGVVGAQLGDNIARQMSRFQEASGELA
jgi:hypothetical protein